MTDADDVTLEELLEARELLEVPAARLAARAPDRGGARAAARDDPGRAAPARPRPAVRLQPGLPLGRARRLRQHAALDRGPADLRRAAAQPRPLDARRALPPRDQRPAPLDRRRDRGRRRRGRRRRDARAPRVPPALLRAGVAPAVGRGERDRGRVRDPGQRAARRRCARRPSIFRESRVPRRRPASTRSGPATTSRSTSRCSSRRSRCRPSRP